MLKIIEDPGPEFLYRGNHVGQPGIHGAARHAVELRRRRRLHEDRAGLLLDRTQTQAAIRAHAGEDHANGMLLPVGGERTEEIVDRQAQATWRGGFEQVQNPVQDRQVAIGWDHINMIRLDLHAVADLDHRHRRGALQQLGHDGLVGRIQMLDNDEGQAASGRQVLEEQFQRLQATGGRPDTNDGEPRFRRGDCVDHA